MSFYITFTICWYPSIQMSKLHLIWCSFKVELAVMSWLTDPIYSCCVKNDVKTDTEVPHEEQTAGYKITLQVTYRQYQQASLKMKFSTITSLFLIFLVVSPAITAQIKVTCHLSSHRKCPSQAVEDRFFCSTMAPTTCANSCAGVVRFEITHLLASELLSSLL